jgi:NAD(P)-dependent dehydrogenase (short-subunit alcohol dehydrogenase family)
MLLENKDAVIYGGCGSIGGAVARAFASDGASVHLAGRTLESLAWCSGVATTRSSTSTRSSTTTASWTVARSTLRLEPLPPRDPCVRVRGVDGPLRRRQHDNTHTDAVLMSSDRVLFEMS